jgi:hypothetical protein
MNDYFFIKKIYVSRNHLHLLFVLVLLGTFTFQNRLFVTDSQILFLDKLKNLFLALPLMFCILCLVRCCTETIFVNYLSSAVIHAFCERPTTLQFQSDDFLFPAPSFLYNPSAPSSFFHITRFTFQFSFTL